MDDYLSLIGAAPTTAEQQKVIADALRRRRTFGELATLTGDKVLQPFGQGLSQQADQYAKQLQQTRQQDADNAQTKQYQDSQIKHWDDVLAETIRSNNLDFQAQMAAIRQREQDSMLDAYTKGIGGGRKITDSTRNKMLQHAETMQSMSDLLGAFNPEYTQQWGAGPQSRLPNLAAQYGVGTKTSKEAQQWWSEWQKFYTLPMRNLLFGATLTPNEQKAWEEVNINPGMSEKQIKTRIGRLLSVAQSSAKRRSAEMSIEGFDPEVLRSIYGDVVPDLDSVLGAGPVIQTGGGRTSRSSHSTSEEGMTPEEIQELQELITLKSQQQRGGL